MLKELIERFLASDMYTRWLKSARASDMAILVKETTDEERTLIALLFWKVHA